MKSMRPLCIILVTPLLLVLAKTHRAVRPYYSDRAQEATGAWFLEASHERRDSNRAVKVTAICRGIVEGSTVLAPGSRDAPLFR